MSANLDNKKQIVEEIKDKIQKAKTVVFADYRGMNVAQDTKMRSEFRKCGAEYKVYKNRLVLRALNELGYTGCESYLEGTNAVAFGYEDEIAPAKIVKESKNENCQFPIKFGIYNNKVITAEEVNKLASIPSRETLLTQLAFMLSSPMRGLAVCLKAIADKNN